MTPHTVLAASCVFPAGPTLALADAALRARQGLSSHHARYRDRLGLPVRVHRFAGHNHADPARWAWLAGAALDAALAELPRNTHPAAPISLWLVLPPADAPGMPPDQALIQAMLAMLDAPGRPNWTIRRQARGFHACGLGLLVEACQHLNTQPKGRILVLAVDARLSPDALLWLEMQNLLHGAANLPYGRVPGEGAAAVILSRRPDDLPHGWARLLGCADADEPHLPGSNQACVGQALGDAAMQAVASMRATQPAPISHILADLNGEPYRADQFAFVALRLSQALQSGWQRITPALVSGDLGCASGLTHLALAAFRLRQRPMASHLLVLASSDNALRAAAVLGAIHPTPHPVEPEAWPSPSTSTA